MRFLILAAALAGLAACERTSVMGELEKQETARSEAAEAAAEKAKAFLETNRSKPGVQATPSGLQYVVVRQGDTSMPRPEATDAVLVHYEGRLADGTVFDSSYARGEPAQFRLNQVVPGWTEGLQLMHPGAEYQFALPPELGYGARGQGPDIGPNEALLFKVELLAFQRGSDGKVFSIPPPPPPKN